MGGTKGAGGSGAAAAAGGGAAGRRGSGGVGGGAGALGAAGSLARGGAAGANGAAAGSSGAAGSGGAADMAGASGAGGANETGGAAGSAGTTGIVDFSYKPWNFDPAAHRAAVTSSSSVRLDCGISTFDSTSLAFGNWCGTFQPTPVTRPQSGGQEIVVLPVASFTVASGATLRLTGARPVVFAVFGDASIAGTIDASANGATPGAGGNQSCGTSQGADGTGETMRLRGASGGGGGGFATAGGKSGEANTDGKSEAPASGGVARGDDLLTPLFGGCAGGKAGGCTTAGGAGGGAVQVSAAGELNATGSLLANGAPGATPCGADDEGGGTGGGSGGAIVLEGNALMTTGATLQVNGGDGGNNGAYAGIFDCGEEAGGVGATSAITPGGDGIDCQGGSPGGGGGYGRVLTMDR